MYRLDSCTAASSASSVMVSLWCASYRSRRPFRISSVASGVGSPTVTGWNRRSSAASFSMYLRYSFRVVAPITRISPRLRAGLRMLAASTAPSAEPAPTMVCSSSMNRITLPSFFTSFRVFLMRSSNSPRYLVPATMPLRSRDRMRLSSSSSGTSPEAMRSARPSAMAVLPTPGSPMSTGLFLLRRERIWMTLWISLSRPMTGSSLPERAASVRSRVYSASALFFLSASRPGAAVPAETARDRSPTRFTTALYILLGSTPTVRRMRRPMLPPSRRMPISRWAVPMALLPMRAASDTASSTTLLARGVRP